MSKEWYLMTPPHSSMSGFENDAMEDFAQDGFLESLDSPLGSDIELCNYNLTECIKMRAIVQGKTQDTQLKTLRRTVLLPIGTCSAGMYIKYDNRYWLIIGLVDDNGVYEKAVITLCNYLLTWLNEKNEVIQRWVQVNSASQYNNGETGTVNTVFRSDQLLINSPDDAECLMLKQGQRFVIDRRCEIYEKEFEAMPINTDEHPFITRPIITYKLTRPDSTVFDYQDSGINKFMVTETEQYAKDGYYIINGKGFWLCQAPIPETEEKKKAEIIGESFEIYNGLEATSFKAIYYDENGLVCNQNPVWKIDSDFRDKLTVEEIDNYIYISVDDSSLINKSFELSLMLNGEKVASNIIAIRAFI